MQFKSIIGQKRVKDSLIQSVKEGRISHAQLFAGPEGNGALPLAIAYIQYLFCKNRGENDSCGTCPECKRISSLSHPDVHFVYPLSLSRSSGSAGNSETKASGVKKSIDVFQQWKEAFLQDPYMSLADWMEEMEVENKQMVIGVEEAREIIHQLSLTSFEGSYKVMIVWMAEKMNATAANKMLKVLEEPPDKTIFILLTESSQLPATVLSRMQLRKIPRIEEDELAGALVSNQGLSKEAAQYLARASEGNYRAARLLASVNEDSEFHFHKFQEWMRICMKLNGEKINGWITEIAGIGRERQKQFLSYSIQVIRQSLLMGVGHQIATRESEKDFLVKFASFLPFNRGAMIADEMNKAYHAIERNGNPRILLMSLSAKIHAQLSN